MTPEVRRLIEMAGNLDRDKHQAATKQDLAAALRAVARAVGSVNCNGENHD